MNGFDGLCVVFVFSSSMLLPKPFPESSSSVMSNRSFVTVYSSHEQRSLFVMIFSSGEPSYSSSSTSTFTLTDLIFVAAYADTGNDRLNTNAVRYNIF